jgi:monoamine oxidase
VEREADVVIVGAGLSGLIAGRKLMAAGRILTQTPYGGVPLEIGAQWIGDTHYRMQALAEELGVTTFAQYQEGQTSYDFGDQGVLREDEFYRRNADDLAKWKQVLASVDEMAVEIDASRPWAAPHACDWDRITAGAWLDAQGMGHVGRTMFEICSVGILAVPTDEVSLLHMLYNIATCGVGAELFAESEGGAQTIRFNGGTSQIPERLAAELREHIVMNAAVQSIDHSDDSVTVTCRGGLVARGRQVIVAIAPPTLAGRIMYDPPVPAVRDQLTQRIPQASAMKAFALYDEPFWREDGLNAQLISDKGPARMSNDSCVADGGTGIILAFLEGEQARVASRWSPQERRDAVIGELALHFGPRAAEPVHYVDGEWASRQWTRGCYNANLGTLGWTHFGEALARPIGPIKWAATETANEWSAYMEGAVEAGERAAAEVLASLDA